ncbi:hypothetical protein PROFUN_16680 [Planoprotostelium fungivorum]|uniref:Uncharacterized protein n=1 Tax=Planoprotostelium fungivorum TaxID=1890364 RepID=A0A2P6MPQ8_9EUKA|nr:hypothetical protein PROFUN_16680 [Planoprotostelium fungivorum]
MKTSLLGQLFGVSMISHRLGLMSDSYNGDLRKGKQSDFEKLLKEHKNASKLGFQYAQWDQQYLQQYMIYICLADQQLHRKIKRVQLVNMIIHSYQTHGFLSLCQLGSNMLKNKCCPTCCT